MDAAPTNPVRPPPPEVIILIGLQAAGKSTFFRERFAATHTHISKDNFPNNRSPGRRQAQLIDEALAARRPVVVDNTNPRRADRADIIAAARRHGSRIIGYYFSARTADSLARNALREGRRRVSDIGIKATAKALELPSLAEGFDELYFVRWAQGGGFEVQPWRDEPPSNQP